MDWVRATTLDVNVLPVVRIAGLSLMYTRQTLPNKIEAVKKCGDAWEISAHFLSSLSPSLK